MFDGTAKEDGSPVTIFKQKNSLGENPTVPPHIENTIKRLKTLRHPTILRFIDNMVMEGHMYIVTEQVQPITQQYIDEMKTAYPETLAWGLSRIATGLSFLNSDCHIRFASLMLFSSVFMTKSGDWKLGNPVLCHPVGAEGESYYNQHHNQLSNKYNPPEFKSQTGNISFGNAPDWSLDCWMFGCLIFEIFQGLIPENSSGKPFYKTSTSNIPSSLLPQYKELLSSNPNHRPTFAKLIKHSPFFQNNTITTALFLETIALKDSFEKDAFFRKLSTNLDSFPKSFNKYKILPHLVEVFFFFILYFLLLSLFVFAFLFLFLLSLFLFLLRFSHILTPTPFPLPSPSPLPSLQALDFGAANSRVLAPLLKIGSLLTPEEYSSLVTPSVSKWFASPDKNLRINLLQNLEHFADHLTPEMVNDDIFGKVALGFQDSMPKMRELTLRSLLYLVPKMKEDLINNQVFI